MKLDHFTNLVISLLLSCCSSVPISVDHDLHHLNELTQVYAEIYPRNDASRRPLDKRFIAKGPIFLFVSQSHHVGFTITFSDFRVFAHSTSVLFRSRPH